MPRHNRAGWPRDPDLRRRAKALHAKVYEELAHEAQQVRKLEETAAIARANVQAYAVQLAREHYLDITEVAAALGTSRETVYRLIRSFSGPLVHRPITEAQP